MASSNPSLLSLSSLQTNEKLSPINCEPPTETVDGGRNPPGTPDSETAEVHKQKKTVAGGSRLKIQRSQSTPSNQITKSAPERRPTVESIAQNAATTTANLSQQNKRSDDGAFKDQRKHDPWHLRESKSKLPKRSASGDDAAVAARETFQTDERVECKAQKHKSAKASSKSEAKVSQPLSKHRAPVKIADKVDKKHMEEKQDSLSDTSAAGTQQEPSAKTAQPVEKYPKNKDNQASDLEASKDALASSSPNTPCRTGKSCDITTVHEKDGPKTTPSPDSEPHESPKIETSLQVPKSPKTGKLMFALKWTLF